MRMSLGLVVSLFLASICHLGCSGSVSSGSPTVEDGAEAQASGGGTQASGGGTQASGGGTQASGGGTQASSGGGAQASGGGAQRSGGGAVASGGAGTQGAGGEGSGGDKGQVPKPIAGMQMGTNFWNLGWGIWDDVFKDDATFATGSNPWNPQFLEELKPYGVLRFMDWSHTNNSDEKTWSERSQPDVPATPNQPLPWEWMIELCNRLDKDMWVNVPHQADADYAKKLAELIHGQLDPQLRVYVEWSNESWNTGFEQTAFARAQGNQLGFSESGADYHVYAAVRVFEQFEKVYGAGDPRLVTVIAGHAVNTWLTGLHLKALEKSAVNPQNIRPDAYGIAPYFGGKVAGNAADVVSLLQADIDAKIAVVAEQSKLVEEAGMQLIAYEGGQHVTSGAEAINGSPEMYRLYTRYLQGMAPNMGVFAHYLHNGQWNDGGAWGAERYVGQPLSEAHKLRAIYDFIKTQK